MSLILEALRKSEAERRRGQVPGLHAELPPAPLRVATTAPWPWRLLLAASALLALAAWLAAFAWRPRAATMPAPVPTAAATAPALPRVAHLQPAVRAERPPAPALAKASAAPPAVAVAAPPAPAPVASAPDRGHAPVSATRGTPPEHAGPALAGAQPASAPSLPAAPPPRATGSAPSQLADLTPEDRKTLPPLRLSMHLWNDDPSRRFVILDGNRLGEGDRIGNLVVTAIVRDGVLLDWNGRAIKVPLR